MANVSTGNPWILDTAAEVLASGTKAQIIKMVFYAGTAGDDLAVSHAGGGSTIWKVRAAAAATNYEDYAGVVFDLTAPFPVDGFVVDVIDGGELWVWIR